MQSVLLRVSTNYLYFNVFVVIFTLRMNFVRNKLDMKDLKNICHLFSNELFHIGIFNKKNKSLQLYELENDYKNELASNLKYFKIDIKDIIKNTKS